MFISFEYLTDRLLSINDGEYTYRIVDDDFEEIITHKVVSGELSYVADFIIDLYEKRNLPVVPNLIRALILCANETKYSLEETVRASIMHVPKLGKYAKDIEKYTLLT